MNKKCRVLGHITSDNYNDSGYSVCLRCGSHQYYHADEWEKKPFYKVIPDFYYRIKWKIYNFFKYTVFKSNEPPF